MPLAVGTRFGPYEILAAAGAGGMGEVYKARDTRLDRTVAVKVLPPHLTEQPEVRQRFEREARALSGLSHPHICTLHDIGEQDGVHYLVMEYLEGETLAQRLEKGALPLQQLLRVAAQVADALDKAHRQGVVHRDLKPGNIMLTKSGAKLLDFGLAKSTGLAASVASSSLSPTVSQPLTAAGTIVGTFQYMAPEQLEGKEADARSDVFAFGAVLYEMATGRPAFEGKSQASLIAAILEREPAPMSEIASAAPPAVLERLIRTCLAKDPDDRWQTMHDVLLELKWIAEGGGTTAAAPAVALPAGKRARVAWLVAGVAALLAVLASVAAVYFASHVLAPEVIRSSIPAPPGAGFNLSGDFAGPFVLSPDGRHLAFAAISADGSQFLWVHSLASGEARLLPGTDGATFPFWSPDGRSLGFFVGGKLKRVDIAGGPPLTVCDAPSGRGGTWSRDGVIVFSPAFGSALFRVPATGGQAEPLTQLDPSQHTSHRWPFFLPDGQHFLYTAIRHATASIEQNAVYVGSLDGTTNRLLLRSGANAAYGSGYLLFLRDTALMAQPFSLSSLELSGEPLTLAQNILYDPTTWNAVFTASQTGLLVYQPAVGPAGAKSLVWFDRAGNAVGTVGDRANYFNVRLSPDGQRLAVELGYPSADIWVYELARGVRTRITFDPNDDVYPLWSRDGRIVYSSSRDRIRASLDGYDIYARSGTGAGAEEVLLKDEAPKRASDWSPDGRFIAFDQGDVLARGLVDVWILPLFGDRKPFPFLAAPYGEFDAAFSPDGRWLAYGSNETTRNEVYVVPFDGRPPADAAGPAGKWQISVAGGNVPRWRRDGRELYYIAPDRSLMAVEVDGRGQEFVVGPARRLFHARTSAGLLGWYDVSPDGQRFIMPTSEEEESNPAALVMNWFAALKARR
jgi:Tol biopolymer transport system component